MPAAARALHRGRQPPPSPAAASLAHPTGEQLGSYGLELLRVLQREMISSEPARVMRMASAQAVPCSIHSSNGLSQTCSLPKRQNLCDRRAALCHHCLSSKQCGVCHLHSSSGVTPGTRVGPQATAIILQAVVVQLLPLLGRAAGHPASSSRRLAGGLLSCLLGTCSQARSALLRAPAFNLSTMLSGCLQVGLRLVQACKAKVAFMYRSHVFGSTQPCHSSMGCKGVHGIGFAACQLLRVPGNVVLSQQL